MIKLQNEKLQTIAAEHGLSKEEFSSQAEKIAPYLEKIHARKQGFYSIIDDQESIDKINAWADENREKYDDCVVIGIGGSALGTICLEKSLGHLFKSSGLHVIDNIDPILIAELEETIDYERTLFIVVSKSGRTPEIISQYHYFKQKTDKFVFITDPKGGVLREIANNEGITAFDIPQNVGGRFSVLTPVGLVPAALIGINIQGLIDGAKQVRDQFLSENFETNLPFQLATIQYLLEQKGKNITVMMPYSQKLKLLADWYKQLLAESIGKATDNKGNNVNTGITPTAALGVTDQHSQSQLYNEGPNDKLLIFIQVQNPGPEIQIPETAMGKTLTFTQLLHIEKEATENSLTQNNRPNITIEIPEVTEETLGQLFMLFEASIAFLGEFYNINAFDQPGVELSKILTKQYVDKLP
jgi:glucose-6-phosphate isomerase